MRPSDPPVGQIEIDSAFNGPPRSANGGVAAGSAAAWLGGGAVEVTLSAPPPLSERIDVFADGESREFWAGQTRVMSARFGEPVDRHATPRVSLDSARVAAAAAIHPDEHSLDTCFVCGPAREPGDGLRLFVGPVPGADCVAGPWTPSPRWADAQGFVRPAILWGALDCPGYFATRSRDFMLLGRIRAELYRPLPVAEPAVVVGTCLSVERRKHRVATAVFDSEGAVAAAAAAIWIQIPQPESMRVR